MAISLFLTWFGPPGYVSPQSPARQLREGAFGSGPISWVALLALAVSIALLVIGSLTRTARGAAPPLWNSALALAVVATALTGFRLLNPPRSALETPTGTAIFTYELSRGVGVYLAAAGIVLALIGVAAAARARGVTFGWVAAGLRLGWVPAIPGLVGVWLFVRTLGAENRVCMYECEPFPVQVLGFTASGLLLAVSALLLRRQLRRHRQGYDISPDEETG